MGLTKTGTTTLQALLAEHRAVLGAAGVHHPLLRPGAHFEGAVEVRGSAARFGLDPERLAGTWEALCAEALAPGEGTAVLSHEVLAGATPDQVARALRPLAGHEVHVVVTARDLGRQAVAHWQERVKLGETVRFADLEREELRADTGRDLGPDEGGRRPRFWHGQDLADTLARWTADLPAGRGHLVVCPAPGAPPAELWRRFADALGVPAGLAEQVGSAAVPSANRSLGAPQVALLREVVDAVGDRLDRATWLRVVKREYAEGELARAGGQPARTPPALGPLLGAATEGWLREVATAGHVVHGDVADLRPVLAGPDDPPVDVPPPAGSDPAAVADRLVASALDPGAAQGQERPGLLRRGARRLRGRRG